MLCTHAPWPHLWSGFKSSSAVSLDLNSGRHQGRRQPGSRCSELGPEKRCRAGRCASPAPVPAVAPPGPTCCPAPPREQPSAGLRSGRRLAPRVPAVLPGTTRAGLQEPGREGKLPQHGTSGAGLGCGRMPPSWRDGGQGTKLRTRSMQITGQQRLGRKGSHQAAWALARLPARGPPWVWTGLLGGSPVRNERTQRGGRRPGHRKSRHSREHSRKQTGQAPPRAGAFRNPRLSQTHRCSNLQDELQAGAVCTGVETPTHKTWARVPGAAEGSGAW